MLCAKLSHSLWIVFSLGHSALVNCIVWSVTEKAGALSTSSSFILCSTFAKSFPSETYVIYLEVILFTLHFLPVEISSTLMILLMLICVIWWRCFFWERVSFSSGWCQTCYVIKGDLELLLILLPPPSANTGITGMHHLTDKMIRF